MSRVLLTHDNARNARSNEYLWDATAATRRGLIRPPCRAGFARNEASAMVQPAHHHRRTRASLRAVCAAAPLLLGTASLAVAAEGKGIRFWNLTSSTIKQLYLSPAGQDAFGSDQCAGDPDGALDHDERLKLPTLAPGRYDLKLVDTSGRVCLVRNVLVETNKVFSVQDKDLTDCRQTPR